MATSRELKNKIRSISNTKKITRTMEMISTAKAQVCRRRIEAAQPYGDKLGEILRDLKAAGEEGEGFPLLRVPEKTKREALWVVTANRGLCGGYNTNVLKMAEKYLDQRKSEGVTVDLHMVGKKGATRFKYLNREVNHAYLDFDDRVGFAECEEVFAPCLNAFIAGELDAVTVIFTHYESSSRQRPITRTLLPISDAPAEETEKESGSSTAESNFIFEPSAEVILDTLLPLSLKTQFFQALLEATTSEQIARRIAMKNATDNAEEMVTKYTQLYNRTRQAGITQEILEIIGGAEVL